MVRIANTKNKIVKANEFMDQTKESENMYMEVNTNKTKVNEKLKSNKKYK